MQFDRVEKLKEEYTDRYVVVDASRPELARFKGLYGQVKTINFNGRALVQFDGDSNRGWYDIELDFLKVVDKPEPKPAETKPQPAKAAPTKEAALSTGEPAKETLSQLEVARMERQAVRGTAGKPQN